MKHFFFPYDTNLYAEGMLNGLFGKYNECGIEQEGLRLKIIYDAADIICDKRFERKDKELSGLVEKYKGNAHENREEKTQRYEFLDSYRSDNRDGKYYRIEALKMLWYYVEEDDNFSIRKARMDGKKDIEAWINKVLYHLVRGNICLRISQCYYENYDLNNSDLWGSKAIEIFWHGKNLAANLRDLLDSPKKMEADLYLRLIKLNIAKYYRDYARKNRRSDFDAALDEFRHVRKRVEDELNFVIDDDIKRKYVLIWMDAVFNIANIHGRKYPVDVIRREVLFCYNCLSHESSDKFSELIAEANKLAECEKPEDLLDHPQIKKDLPGLCADSFKKCDALEDYDKKRYFLLILLEISRIYRNRHFDKNYRCAMAMAIIADQWSCEMDKRGAYTPGHNIDALITLSSSLRKYVKYGNGDNQEGIIPQTIKISVKQTEQSLYLRDESGNVENNIASLSNFVGKLIEFAENDHLKSKTEVIKWYCLYRQNKDLLKDIFDDAKNVDATEKNEDQKETKNIEKFLEGENGKKPNLQLQFLQGLVYFRSGKYSKAIEVFRELTAPHNKETQYIRQGTIGLKARYLLANCYMARAEFSNAESILKLLKDTLTSAKKSWSAARNMDFDVDFRIEIDLGYCYMQRGEFEKAIEIYKKIYGDGSDGEEFNLPGIQRERQIMGLNNFAACCIYSIKDSMVTKSEIEEKESNIKGSEDKGNNTKESKLDVEKKRLLYAIETARKIFCFMEQKPFQNKFDPETNLLKGYYTLCAGIEPGPKPITKKDIDSFLMMSVEDRKCACILAHEYFRKSCRHDDAFASRYNLLDEKGQGNKARYRDEVERISVYIINLTKLYKLYLTYSTDPDGNAIRLGSRDKVEISEQQKGYLLHSKLNLERFILNFPTTYKISLKAAIALAEWLFEYEKECNEQSDKINRLDQFYRSFSYITIYEERGAQVFNNLRNNSKFRLFSSAERGRLLALLLVMYKPIKAVKEECCFNLDDKKFNGSELKLVHYTKIESLKKILSEEQNGKKTEPRFRINNCGYMNDVFEGNIFLKSIVMVSSEDLQIMEKLENMSGSDRSVEDIIDIPDSNFVKKYFPQLSRSLEDMLPSGSNVYIGSLSVKEDSFPMWSVYAANETGCNIEFGDDFFDIDGNPCLPRALRDYTISRYTDQDYPLYIVQYIGSQFIDEYIRYTKMEEEDFGIFNAEGCRQYCGTEAIRYRDLFRLFKQISKHWKELDDYLENRKNEKCVDDSIEVIRAFAADRINEIRFLFKNADYEFEGEVRVIYTDSADLPDAQTDESVEVPKVYVRIERDLQNLTVRLGSRIEDAVVDKYVTWLKHTKRVKKVGLARRNRYTK